ncbi:MAG: alpha-amylase [Spirochaetia bacterium]|nr:alpha-amylase [Spirochaetia bacterium]
MNHRTRIVRTAAALVWLMFIAGCGRPPTPSGSGAAKYETVAPGTVEQLGHPLMASVVPAHEVLKPTADEVVVYYVRADKNYEPWGFWLWALPGGDGAAAWSQTQKLSVVEGVAYLKFRKDGYTLGMKTVGPDGQFGLIPRKDASWDKDGDKDRVLDASVSNEWVVFEKDQKTYPYGPYTPTIDGARLVGPRDIVLDLSGRYGLDTDGGPSGFAVRSADGSREFAVAGSANNADPGHADNNYARRVLVTLKEDAPLDLPLVAEHPSFLAPAPVNTAAYAAERADTLVPPEGYRLGAIYDQVERRVEFRLWSPFASRVAVRLYRKNQAAVPDFELDLSRDPATGVWSGSFDAVDPDGFFYEYSVFSGSSERVALDPYAVGMDVFTGSGPGRGAIINPARTLPPGGWEGLESVDLGRREDAVIYELSVRDFTIAPEAGVRARPGSYLAFIEKLPYLRDLGVTHVQLMPVLNFYYTDELRTGFEANARAHDNNYNWGYDPHSYFTPEGWYASDPRDPYKRIVELKTLIREIHRTGMGVILDVVYNHTANVSVLDDVVPGYYYRRDATGALTSQSGCGNDVASERTMASRLIRDSIYHWVSEYKVDGFRFDLMGLIDADTILKARQAVAALPGKTNILFQGEGWKMYQGPALAVLDQNYMGKTNLVSVFNDEFRDILKAGGLNDRAKGFITDKPVNTEMIFNNLAGRPMLNYSADQPGDSMNYVSAHDNLTLADNIAFNMGLSRASAAGRAEIAARAKLAYFLVLTGQPIPFLHGGDERGRTKPRLKATSEVTGDYVHNSYDASDDINQFPWKVQPEFESLARWVRGLIAIRKAEPSLRLGDAGAVSGAMTQLTHDDQRSMGWVVRHGGVTLVMLVNARSDKAVTFETGMDLSGAAILANGVDAAAGGVSAQGKTTVQGTTVTVEPLAAVMLKL